MHLYISVLPRYLLWYRGGSSFIVKHISGYFNHIKEESKIGHSSEAAGENTVCMYVYTSLQVLAGYPHNGQERGEHLLLCMRAVVPNLHEELVDLWDAVIPKLLSYLTGTCT